MYQIITAVIAGTFMLTALLIQQVLLSRKRKTEDLAGTIIPRRAELYRDFMQKICETGVQYDYDNTALTPKERIVLLHETCNRALYELCPFAGINAVNAIMKLSDICAKHRPLILTATEAESEQRWINFKWAFQFDFMTLRNLMCSDCMGPALDRFVDNANTRKYVAILGWPWKTGEKARKQAKR
jgi:hypothetical protein